MSTPTGVPIIPCDECGREHPAGRGHCLDCGRASFFRDRDGRCLKCQAVN